TRPGSAPPTPPAGAPIHLPPTPETPMSAPALTLLVRPLCAPSEAQPHAFAGPRVTIGRDRRCDLPLVNAHRAVSRRHAEIRRAEGHFLLIDLGSKNATLLNGRRLLPHRPHLLRAGDHVRIGD